MDLWLSIFALAANFRITNSIGFITFYYPYMVEKVLILSQILKMEILIDLHVLRSPESENRIFAVGLCVSLISITQKQAIA